MDLLGTQVFLLGSWNRRRNRVVISGSSSRLIFIEEQSIEMCRDGDQGLDGTNVDISVRDIACSRFLVVGRGFEGVDVAEFGDDGTCLDEFIEEIVVGGRVGKESVACGDAESDQIHQGGA